MNARSYHPGSPDKNSPLYDDPLYGHPWQSPVQREAKRRARHARWLASLTARDWSQIKAAADAMSPLRLGDRLDDLDAPGIAVGVCPAGDDYWLSGERIGTLRGGTVAVLVWLK